jgi:ribose transport system substrate-binding protein
MRLRYLSARSQTTHCTRLVVLAIVAVAALAGCPSSYAASASSQAAAARAAASRVAAAERPVTVSLSLSPIKGAAALRGKTILVVPVVSIPFEAVIKALGETISAAGMKMKVCDGEGVPSTVSSCMALATGDGASAVMTLGVPFQEVPRAYENLAAHRIPALAAIQDPDGHPSSKELAFALQSPALTKAAEDSADYIIAKTKAAANVLIVGASDSPTLDKLTATTISYFHKECPGCTVHADSTTITQLDNVPSLVSAWVLAHPDTNYVFPIDVGNDGTGVLSGLQSANRTNIPLGGSDMGFQGGLMIKEGDSQFVEAISANFLAWEWTDATLRLIVGQPQVKYPVVSRLLDASNSSNLTFNAANSATFKWFGVPTYQATFRKAWGVS